MMQTKRPVLTEICPKGADGIANGVESVDLDQTAPLGAV